MCAEMVVAGHLCLDISPKFHEHHQFDQIFSPGRLTMVDRACISLGGAVANTGLAARKLGVDVVLMAKFGKDYFGKIITEFLANASVKNRMSIASDVSSSYTIALNPPGTDRIFLHHPGANDYFSVTDLDMAEIGQSRLFHFGYPPLMKSLYSNNGEELLEILSRVKETGATTSLDLAMPDPQTESGRVNWEKILTSIAPFVDVFLPSYEELYFMLAHERYLKWRSQKQTQDLSAQVDFGLVREFAQKLQGLGMGAIVIKAGKNGIYLRTPPRPRLRSFGRVSLAAEWIDQELWAEAYEPPVFVSSTGAGDCAIAGFLTALLRNHDPREAVKLATIAGCMNLGADDSISGLGDWPRLVGELNHGTTPHHHLQLSRHGYTQIADGLWSAA